MLEVVVIHDGSNIHTNSQLNRTPIDFNFILNTCAIKMERILVTNSRRKLMKLVIYLSTTSQSTSCDGEICLNGVLFPSMWVVKSDINVVNIDSLSTSHVILNIDTYWYTKAFSSPSSTSSSV